MDPEMMLSKPERLRRACIRSLCLRCGVPERASEFVRENKTVQHVERALIGEGVLALSHVTDGDIKAVLCGGV